MYGGSTRPSAFSDSLTSSGLNSAFHSEVRVARKPMLESTGSRECEPREGMMWTGYGFQVIPDSALSRIEFEQESFLALLGVTRGRDVEESELRGRVDRLEDAAKMERP